MASGEGRAGMSIGPGGTIGILGGGQLGRMLSMAAARLGLRCHIYAPEKSGPAADVSARWVRGDYADATALAAFADTVDVVTWEFENIPVTALGAIAAKLRPNLRALEVAQDRLSEKRFAEAQGGRPAAYRMVDDRVGLDAALAAIGVPAILKTRRFGYDGKGQARIRTAADADAAWGALGAGGPLILEQMIAFDSEFSILVARGEDGRAASWDAPANAHVNGILKHSLVPADAALAGQIADARALACRIAQALDYVGVLACEFFATAEGPVFNEMAPRVHNSGHWTIEGAATSQFENHVRAVCGLPLGATRRTAPRVAMENLIGREADGWAAILAEPGAHLHLYGKGEARPGRKMGHVTRLMRG